MAKPIHAIDFLAKPAKHPAAPVCVAFGDDPFLRRAVVAALREQVLGGGDADFSFIRFEGDSIELRDALDELATVALFGGGRRLVVVDEADEFVSRYRPQLEDYVAWPVSSGVLVLVVKTWMATTRLAKALAETGLAIECKPPSESRLLHWLVDWAKHAHGAALDSAAADMLLAIVGPEMGFLDQQLAKLAVMVEPGEPITAQLVQEAVGGWRTKTTWEMLDSAADGNARDALMQLDQLLISGEHPVALLAQMGSSLRRFSAATGMILRSEAAGRKVSLRPALEAAGFKPFVLGKAEAQLRQLGRHRGRQLSRWLLEADLALKGASSSPPRARIVLEQLIVRMSSALQPRQHR